jgi:hypothetical protein
MAANKRIYSDRAIKRRQARNAHRWASKMKNMMRNLFFIIFLFLFVSPAHSYDPFAPSWKSLCKCGDTTLNLSFTSKSGDATEDDMTAKLISSDGKELDIPIDEALYRRRSIVSDERNICDSIGGFKLSNNRVLLWLSRNDRPHWDKLSLILIDYKKLIVLDVKENIGSIKDTTGKSSMTIRKKHNGYEVRLEREWLQNTNTDTAENSIEDWMYIGIVDNKIYYEWAN